MGVIDSFSCCLDCWYLEKPRQVGWGGEGLKHLYGEVSFECSSISASADSVIEVNSIAVSFAET
jgi:hypothetical protein